MTGEAETESRQDQALDFFRALADGDRMRIAAALIERALTLEQLAEAVRLAPGAVTRHLGQLQALGLVMSEAGEDGTRYRFDTDALNALKRAVLGGQRPRTEIEAGDEWERKVLRDFLVGERLKTIPAQPKKRAAILHWLAEQFAPGECYPERQVNELLARHHPDFATLRRELVDSGLLRREAGVYWRTSPHLNPDGASPNTGRGANQRMEEGR
ncbi:MAG TPA: DUF2087 domain-containing protein [Thermomicrobiaceae bacterium]|nr:DUF2087 domain-containing protein [Thermomicrobiaceae bacterium]